MTARNVPFTRTLVRPLDVYLALRDAWRAQLGDEPARASLLVLLSQWDLETAGGSRCMNYNLGGIKHTPNDGNDWADYLTTEVLDGQVRNLQQSFRAYSSLEDSAADYLTEIRARFAAAWPAVLAGDPGEFARLLKTARYYTAPEQQYAAGLQARYASLDRQLGPDTTPALAPDRSATLDDEAMAVAAEPPDSPEAA